MNRACNKHLKCVVKGCSGKTSLPQRRLFRFPKDPSMRTKWCENLRIDENFLNTKARVCSVHFEINAINTRKVKREAVPTLKLGHKLPLKHVLHIENYSSKVWRKCGVRGCDVNKTKEFRFFAIPQDSRLRNAWFSALDIDCSTKHVYVCGKHFAPQDVGNFKLRKNAVPMRSDNLQIPSNELDHIEHVDIEILDDETTTDANDIEDFQSHSETEAKCTCACHDNFDAKESYYIRKIEALQEEIRLLKKTNKLK